MPQSGQKPTGSESVIADCVKSLVHSLLPLLSVRAIREQVCLLLSLKETFPPIQTLT